MGTIVEAETGASISGDEIADIIKESKLTGIPMAILLHRLKNVSVKAFIEPDPAVPKKALRTPRKKR